MTQRQTRSDVCARFCRSLEENEPVTHFHSYLAEWDGQRAWDNPLNFSSTLACLRLSPLPLPPSNGVDLSDDDIEVLAVVPGSSTLG